MINDQIQNGTKFILDGNYNVAYRYHCQHDIFEKEHLFIRTVETGEQCNAVLFQDHMLVYKFIGLLQLECKIDLNRLTILN